MSRSLQDQFIDDDEEETCPLCVEEFDLTDKGFRPCPCGYQICQFCYHNVKTNMNGLCPACRRPYNDDDIEYKVITAEETAAHKARQAQKQKKTQAALQKEKQKAEADHLSRKHLAGLRVVQKNLVYVTGLSPSSQEDQLLQTLRGDQYFGQYGKIIKIVVSKAKDPSHPHSVGVYVTYERKEDAASCIAAVDGSKNGDRTLRAQFGTTKYCSAYLRNETCSNRNCMFLHEPGEANESYSRADLSALNAGSSQHGPGRPPPPQSQQPVASAAQPMSHQGSADHPPSPADRPALPSTASWASKPPEPNRAESRSTSTTVESPESAAPQPASTYAESTGDAEPPIPQPAQGSVSTQSTSCMRRARQISPLNALLNGLKTEDFTLRWSSNCVPPADLEIVNNYPSLFRSDGGAIRRWRRQREEEQSRMEQEAQAYQQPPSSDLDENPELSGSLQLGGEPEERQSLGQIRSAIQPPAHEAGPDQRLQLGGLPPVGAGNERAVAPQQQQMLLQSLKSGTPGGYRQGGSQSNNFPSTFQPPGHERNVSRYSFANETASASATVKPVANAKLMNQQSAMMPPTGGNHFGAQPSSQTNPFFTSNVQGPPPGLKTTGTPPVSGNLTFGQGHGFATGGLQYNAATRNQQDNYYRDLLRGRDAAGGNMDAKHDGVHTHRHSASQRSIASRVSVDESRRSTPPIPPGFEGQVTNESRRATPTLPPGLTKPTGMPDLGQGASKSPSSRSASGMSIKRSVISPALPLRPATPLKDTVKETTKLDPSEPPVKSITPATSEELVVVKSRGQRPGSTAGFNAESANTERKSTPLSAVDSESSKSGPGHEDMARKRPASSLQKHASAFEHDAEDASAIQSSDEKSLPTTADPPTTRKIDRPKQAPPRELDSSAALSKPADVARSATAVVDTIPAKKPPTAGSETSSTTAKPLQSSGDGHVFPAAKLAPRTLRIATPKTDTAPTAPDAVRSASAGSSTAKRPNRQPSNASLNLPETPSSEQTSAPDNASIPSASVSRANSPPVVNSQPVPGPPARTKAKSQKAERAKGSSTSKPTAEDSVKAVVEEPAQEAIISRKKKAKKDKEPKSKEPKAIAKSATATAESTPTASRPPSPGPKTLLSSPTREDAVQVEEGASTPATPAKRPDSPVLVQQPSEMSPPSTPTLTAAQLIAELEAATPNLQKCIDSLFRVSNSSHFKPPQEITARDITDPNILRIGFEAELTKHDVDALLTGKRPVIRFTSGDGQVWSRGIITSSGAYLQGLGPELEARFLELEKKLREMPDEFQFRPPKPQNATRLPTFPLEDLRRQLDSSGGRGVSTLEPPYADPTAAKKPAHLVDDANRYLNQFITAPSISPPTTASSVRSPHTGVSLQPMPMAADLSAVPSVDVAERQLNEARRVADEKEAALRKVMKRNKKVFGWA